MEFQLSDEDWEQLQAMELCLYHFDGGPSMETRRLTRSMTKKLQMDQEFEDQ